MTHTLFNVLPAGRRLVRSALIVLLVSGTCVFAQEVDPSTSELMNRYSGGITSAETAERALAEVKAERSAIQGRFAAAESACHAEFFANACADKAKERRRVALEQLRKVEVDANAFLRRDRVARRDKALEEKNAERERKEAERLKQGDPTAVAKPPKTPREAAPAKPDIGSGDPDPREERHQARLKRLEERDRADAQKRADNVAAYEKKVKQAEERQRQVEERKKKKEKERAGRSQPD